MSDTNQKPIPIRGIQGSPVADHVDGLKAALLELAERCGELRREASEKLASSRDRPQVDYIRARLKEIAHVAMQASGSSHGATLSRLIDRVIAIHGAIYFRRSDGVWYVGVGGADMPGHSRYASAATLIDALEILLKPAT